MGLTIKALYTALRLMKGRYPPSRVPRAHPLLLCFLDGGDLLGHHGQHLDVDPIKLIKARPGPRTK